MAQQAQGQFGYQTVRLIKTEPLGTGSYGAVYNAKLPEENKKENQKENKYLPEESREKSPEEKRPDKGIHKTFEIQKRAPCPMLRGSSTMYGSVTYFGLRDDRKVLSYNSVTKEWSHLPECPRVQFTLAVVNDLVTAVGGKKDGERTNTLLSFKEEAGGSWVEKFPHMQTKRKYPAVVCSENNLVVAGGLGRNRTTLTTIEVMNTDTLVWSKASSLPQPLADASATVHENRIYLVGGSHQYDCYTKSVFSCSLRDLLQSAKVKTSSPAWDAIEDLPVERSTSVILNRQVLAVGGYDEDDTDNIYLYNKETKKWKVIGKMHTPRCLCLVTVLPGNKLMVVGGMSGDETTDEVEIVTIGEKDEKIRQVQRNGYDGETRQLQEPKQQIKQHKIAQSQQDLHQREEMNQKDNLQPQLWEMNQKENQHLQPQFLEKSRKKGQQLKQLTPEKDHAIEARERQLQELNQELVANKQVTELLQLDLSKKEILIQKLQEENQHLQLESDKVLQLPMTAWKGKHLHIADCKKVPKYL